MIGAIIGDIVGSRFERANHRSKEFELFDKKCKPTDDSIMSLAVAKAILECEDDFGDLSTKAITNIQGLGRLYKNAGYGSAFRKWLWSENPKPYHSFGNGAAMRVSPCGYAARSLEETKELSAKVTMISHDHPEGMKGAEAISVAIYLAKSGKSKEEIRNYIRDNYYETDFTIEQIRRAYKFDNSCQGSVPMALEAFFESVDFEDAIRNAISVGGDSDTIASMAGAVAEVYYGVPESIIDAAIRYLDSREMEILYYFEKKYLSKAIGGDGEGIITVFHVLDDAVDKVIPAGTVMEVDGELSGGAACAWVPNEDMLPDFSSYDKPSRTKETKRLPAKVGSDISKAVKEVGKRIFSTARPMKENMSRIKGKTDAKAVKCYAISIENPEDTEKTMHAVDVLKNAGYETKVGVDAGTMYGYVFVGGDDFDKAAGLLESVEGVALSAKPVDKAKAKKARNSH